MAVACCYAAIRSPSPGGVRQERSVSGSCRSTIAPDAAACAAIAAYYEIRTRVEISSLPIVDDLIVLRVQALLYHVILGHRIAAIRQVDTQARGSIQIIDARILDCGIQSTALDLIADRVLVEVSYY